MKRKTAIAHALAIAQTIRDLSGIIGTPTAGNSAFRIKRLWLFGSTAKGAESPHDVDLLYEGIDCGRKQRCLVYSRRRVYREVQTNMKLSRVRHYCAREDKRFLKRFGIHIEVDAKTDALSFLRGKRKLVRFHDIAIDGKLAFPRILLYPRNDIDVTHASLLRHDKCQLDANLTPT